MGLLLTSDALRSRANVAADELAPLAEGLLAELAPLQAREIYLPTEKALLSREGGRCPEDGSTLDFDPFSPHRHRCPKCGEAYGGTYHDRFWNFWYQLWLAERALHGALLANLCNDDRAALLSATILERYVDQYLRYPNRDNVLGPTRLFFSTYLESIWLLNVCIAIDLLEGYSPRYKLLGAEVRERIIAPAASIITLYDEGASNRQVWNDAAMIAANRLLDRREAVERAIFGRSGLTYHLQHGLLSDGTWYEGENYHLFAHRGLWYCLTMAEEFGAELSSGLVDRFQEGFVTPFLTSLPDLTLPSRRDSQYAISLRQPRFAELCELGLARAPGDGDPRLRSVLYRLYAGDISHGDIGRARSTADVERNLPATALSRADLGWRSLLFARTKLPKLEPAPLGTVLLEAQGIAVFRRDRERVYLALDYGTSGGGHGHPDRLNLLLSDGTTRWLDDMGTGSYVDPSLHWYRSTLAHNAPMFDGKDQERVDGELLAFDEGGEVGWVSARALNLAPGVTTSRTLVATEGYVFDELTWRSATPLTAELPIHVEPTALTVRAANESESPPVPSQSHPKLDDPLRVLGDISSQAVDAQSVLHITAHDGDRVLRGFLMVSSRALLYHGTGPGAPGSGRRAFLLLRVPDASDGWVRTVWDWSGRVIGMSVDGENVVSTVERSARSRDDHRRTEAGWHIERLGGTTKRAITLGGVVRRQQAETPPVSDTAALLGTLQSGRERLFELAAESYRRSEQSWDEADRPSARVTLRYEPNELVVDMAVRKVGSLTFVPLSAINPYDNESADINGDGVQLYIADALGATAWVLIPELNGVVRSRSIDGWNSPRGMVASWEPRENGYLLRARVSLRLGSSRELSLGIVINEKPPERERRRGQLVLGGAPGEFVYLRGDRENRDTLPRFRFID
jgi:hypothetical protein